MHYPQILHDLSGHVPNIDHTFLRDVGFDATPYMGHIQKDLTILATLFERWDPTINAFHLPIGPIIITMEDIHRILRLLPQDIPRD